MADLPDVAAGVGDDARDIGQCAGRIKRRHGQPHDATATHQRALSAADSTLMSMLPPDRMTPTVCPAEAQHALFRQRSNADRAGAFAECLLDFEQQRDRILDRTFSHDQDVVGHRFDDVGREPAGRLDRDALRDGSAACVRRRGVTPARDRHGGEEFGLHAEDADVWLQGFGRDRDACQQAAAPDGYEDRVQLRCSFKHFERDRAWPAMTSGSS